MQEFLSPALRKFASPMSIPEAEQFFDTALRPLLDVHPSPAQYISALQIHGRHHFSWYESLIVAALQAECSILYTEDMQDGHRLGNLKIVNPFL